MLMFKSHPLMKMLDSSLLKLPSPSFITYKWNFGFILSALLITQIITGLFLSMHYSANINLSFENVVMICRDVNSGWIFRMLHANGASFFFFLMYLHLGRGLYYSSFKLKMTWNLGVLIILISMLTAFVGYVLPWGQMSFWGATVITNLLSVVPYAGNFLVEWVWGGFSVSMPTLKRFYTFHFLFPFIILVLVMMHLIFLHDTGSNNPLGMASNIDSVGFHPYFTWKDILGYMITVTVLMVVVMKLPYTLGDSENFIPSNPLVTPVHIQPEWYLLFAYSILRSIPNKMGGVLFLLMSILSLSLYSLLARSAVASSIFLPVNKMFFWSFVYIVIVLTWLGACPVEAPYIALGQVFTSLYFLYFLLNYYMIKFWVALF